jgi:hypothetical protein
MATTVDVGSDAVEDAAVADAAVTLVASSRTHRTDARTKPGRHALQSSPP